MTIPLLKELSAASAGEDRGAESKFFSGRWKCDCTEIAFKRGLGRV
jgi:hypothetical protein